VEIREYLRMLRRGWPVIVLVTLLGIALSGAYLVLAPKQYQSQALILLVTTNPKDVSALEYGQQYGKDAAPTYADVIDSSSIFEVVAKGLTPRRSVADLETMVSTQARESTSLIEVNVTAPSAAEAANIANLVARQAQVSVPNLVGRESRSSAPILRLVIVRDAPVPPSAVSPNPKRVLAIGFIVGAALGLALTLLQQALDTRLRRPEDLYAAAPVPLLAVLPRPKRSQRTQIVVRDDPGGQAVEAYRSLRTNLVHLESTERPSILFTGIGHRDDVKVPLNLAWSMAQAGRRVLLIDLDLRQSSVADLLDLPQSAGMSDVLAGGAEFSDLVQQTSQPGLSVLVSGTTQPSPSDLLSSPVVAQVLRSAEAAYDLVVLHAPPLLAYTDAAVVSRVAGSTVISVRSGNARAVDLTRALVALQNVAVEPLGLVLAGARAHVGDTGKARGISTRPRSPVRVQWDQHPDPTDTQPRQDP
jgi:succinoglycan biosynthesis transport protein ExoP